MTNPVACHHCSKPLGIDVGSPVPFRESCSHCGADMHVCKNCSFFDAAAHHECRESSAEWVRDKERGNRCEYFRLGNQRVQGVSKQSALDALDSLFKK